ncbi:MAG: hypothetical protein IBJ15_00215 [Alphaproteobacteria bacterium]|nr:hypothetical protein [Alphaproteobacteria bacterium]
MTSNEHALAEFDREMASLVFSAPVDALDALARAAIATVLDGTIKEAFWRRRATLLGSALLPIHITIWRMDGRRANRSSVVEFVNANPWPPAARLVRWATLAFTPAQRAALIEFAGDSNDTYVIAEAYKLVQALRGDLPIAKSFEEGFIERDLGAKSEGVV